MRSFSRIVQLVVLLSIFIFAVQIPQELQGQDDKTELLEKWKQQQEAIQKLLPSLEAATVCLEAGGGSGSGVIVNEDGLIATAAHVVEGQQEMTVRFANGKVMRCKVLGGYRPADAALAQIIEPGPHPFVKMAASDSVKRGQTIISLGNPSGFDEHRGLPLRLGHIRNIQSYQYSSDCALIGGDSGGPGFNLDGELIGIHSTISSDVSTNNDILIDIFHREWDSMLKGEWRGDQLFEPENREEDVVFGVQLFAPEQDKPVRVQSVAPNSPAAWAGLQAGDEIIEVNGESITNSAEFLRNVTGRTYGLEFELTVQRDDEKMEFSVELATRQQLKEKKAELLKQKKNEQNGVEKLKDEDLGQTSTRSKTGVSLPVRFNNGFAHRSTQQEDTLSQQDDEPDEDEQDADDEEVGEKTELQLLFEESQSSRGELTIEREKLLELRKKLRKRMDSLAPAGGRAEDQWTRSFESVFKDHVINYSRSIFPIFVVGRNVASAVVIDSDGVLLTKLSEIEGRKPQIRIDDESMIEVKIVAKDNRLDLALVQVLPEYVKATEWIPVDLGNNREVSTVKATDDPATKGTVCCAISSRKERAAGLGIVSVASRSLDGRTTSYIGVQATVEENGIKVSGMVAGGPAERAGVKVGDVINGLNNEPVTNMDDFKKLVESHLPGEKIQLGIIRRDSWLTLPVTLGDKSKVAPMPGAAEQGHDSAATAMSRRRWNFTQGIQHDCAIPPKACGGLLIDLDGQVIGINIARAGRIKSYAIPVSLAKQFVEGYMNGKGASE